MTRPRMESAHTHSRTVATRCPSDGWAARRNAARPTQIMRAAVQVLERMASCNQ